MDLMEVSVPMSLLSFTKSMDRGGSYEKLSIRESGKSLKKYGSTSSNKINTKNEYYLKHFISNSDTLQGIALRYNVTIEQIRRANKLWASDSLFLKEFLLIPQLNNDNNTSTNEIQSSSSQSSFTTSSPPNNMENLPQNIDRTRSSLNTRQNSFDEENISDFLSKIDASIANTKEVVEKVTRTGEFGSGIYSPPSFSNKPQARLKQHKKTHQQSQNNNIQQQNNIPMNTVVSVQQGKKVKTSLELHEQQQEELFEL